MVRRRLVQPHLQKLPQAQRIGYPPGDPPLAVDPLEKPDQHQPEVHPRHQRRPPQLLVVEPLAPTLAEPIEVGFFQYPIQPLVERVPRCLGQFGPIPQRLLSLTLLPWFPSPWLHLKSNILAGNGFWCPWVTLDTGC